MGNEFILLTGEDGNVLEFNKRGGVGCISVTANIAPKLCSNFQNFSKPIYIHIINYRHLRV